MVVILLLTGRSVDRVQESMDRVSQESVPMAADLAKLESSVYGTLASLRGWMLTGDTRFERERTSTWKVLARLESDLDQRLLAADAPHLSADWTRFKTTLGELKRHQDQIARIAHSPDELPATRLLLEEAAPLDELMYRQITRIINVEKQQPATPARKELFGVMADLRGSTAAGFAMLRTYVLSGEERFKDEYQNLARTRDARLATLEARHALLTGEQRIALASFAGAHEEFTPLAVRLVRIRAAPDWNVAQHLLATEAVPRAESLLEFLAGRRRQDGFRQGGEVAAVQGSLLTDARAVLDETEELRSVLWLLLGLGVAVPLVLVFWLSRSLVKPIEALGGVVGNLIQGDMTVEVPGTERSDEIGETARALATLSARLDEIAALCRKVSSGDYSSQIESRGERDSIAISVNAMVDDFQKIVAQALLISEGDYSVAIAPKSEHDTLGTTLATMTQGLREMSERDRREAWLRAGQRLIAETALGRSALADLSRNLVTRLCEYIGAQVGAIYIADSAGALQLTGSYAFTKRKHMQTAFKPGEGLVGQVALERQRILLTQVPADYIFVTSGLGAAPPRHILVSPLSMGDELKGVIELGSLEGFSETDCDLVDLVTGHLAIAINTAQNVEDLERLIAESTRQAQELAQQSEELRATNEELHEKGERLARSQEELQVQSEELRVSNEELHEKANALEQQKAEIAAKNQALERARAALQKKANELEQSGRYKSEFLANMSHELRTPLNSVLILAGLLAENREGNLSADQVESAGVIYSSGKDLLRLIDDILDLSKVEAGMLDIIVEPVGLEALCTRMHRQFEPVARERDIPFEVECAPDLPGRIETDRVRAEQILKNLLSNAFKFIDGTGSVRLRVHRPPADITWRTRRLSPSTAIGFSVIDTGIGIPEAKQATIFNAFQQADGSTSRKYGGTGLGLTISQELAHLLGGEIHLHSRPGEGATFTLYLPGNADTKGGEREREPSVTDLARHPVGSRPRSITIPPGPESAAAAPDRSRDAEVATGENERLLLVIEDDRNFAGLLVRIAQERGYQCTLAYDGATGLQMALTTNPDAIILDLGLPGFDGLSVLEQLKFHLSTRHIPVHIISARDRGAEGLRMGAIGHLVKPVDADDLAQVFARVERYIDKQVKSVLLVEDDPVGRDAIVALIASDTIEIAEASSGEQALAALRTDDFECVILDLGLPDTSGFDLLRTLHADAALDLPPIIVYTGRDLSREEHALVSELASSIVVKGATSPERLLDEVLLFLHSIEDSLQPAQRHVLRDLHDPEQVLRGRKILLADDNLRNSFALAGALRAHGVTVIIADDGQLALDKLAQEPDIDLVIMDIMMPVMDGYEAIGRIRAQARWRALPIIALTAKAMPEDRARCLAAGANDYMTKPVETERLLSLLRVWLFGSR